MLTLFSPSGHSTAQAKSPIFTTHSSLLMQYVIHAYDYTDDQAFTRRMSVRANHLEGAATMKANGNFILGGALLSPEGQMIGSMMILDFEEECQLNEWLKIEPYITGKVWEKIDIKPFRQASV